MTFSTRYGHEVQKPPQFEEMDQLLQNSLWNACYRLLDALLMESRENFHEVINFIWTDFFRETLDQYDHAIPLQKKQILKQRYNSLSWHKKYSFIEFIAQLLLTTSQRKFISFKEECNYLMERENAAYRFVDAHIVPIVSATEIKSIEDAITSGNITEKHLKNSLENIASRKYRQSCSESINAVEACAQNVSGQKKGVLSELCRKRKLQLHPALLNSIEQFYAWSSDEKRHAEKPESETTVTEAIATLTICSSYINIIKEKSN